jgi:hypothetical protein
MLSLRELIIEIDRLDILTDVAKCTFELNEQYSNVDQITKTYKSVTSELKDLPGSDELQGHNITIIDNKDIDTTCNGSSASEVNRHVSVLLCDNDERFALDFVDWNELIDLPIRDTVCEKLSERLSRILYEITFWGHTRASVLQEGEETRRAAEDKDNLIVMSLDEFVNQINETES